MAAIANVPIFLLSLFLLQTKFRPELQEDSFYATYINQKTNQTVSVSRDEQRFVTLLSRMERVEILLSSKEEQATTNQRASILSDLTIGVNKNLLNKQDIIDQLKVAGAVIISRFGNDEMPEKHVVSLAKGLPRSAVVAVLTVAREMGFAKYSFFDPVMEEIDENVLFGSYGSGDLNIE